MGLGGGQGAVPGNQAELLHTHFSLHFFLRFLFLWTVFKVFTELVTVLLLLYVLFFWL